MAFLLNGAPLIDLFHSFGVSCKRIFLKPFRFFVCWLLTVIFLFGVLSEGFSLKYITFFSAKKPLRFAFCSSNLMQYFIPILCWLLVDCAPFQEPLNLFKPFWIFSLFYISLPTLFFPLSFLDQRIWVAVMFWDRLALSRQLSGVCIGYRYPLCFQSWSESPFPPAFSSRLYFGCWLGFCWMNGCILKGLSPFSWDLWNFWKGTLQNSGESERALITRTFPCVSEGC